MRKLVPVVVFALFAAVSSAQTIPELFAKAKDQVKAGSWKDALTTLDSLDTESQKPGNENVHAQLEAPLAFYRGVCQSNLNLQDKAAENFRVFLKAQPNASIDSAVYGKKTAAAFERAQKELAERPPSLAEAYKEFRPRPDAAQPVDEKWADGPVRYILTDAQKAEFAALKDPNARTDWVEKFWAGRASAPGSEGRTYRQEFDRRVAFADANFAPAPEQRGSLTDRGMVFVLLGPPSFAGRKPLRVGDDASVESGNSAFGSQDASNAEKTAKVGTTTSGKLATLSTKYGAPTSKAAESAANHVETWHYRREVLPKGVPFQQVDFSFVTKQGAGADVLDRDANAMNTLSAAR
ncbi:MAG TPA: GWxTD domain-containing protein [Thermoanaerobaculia bacterium]|jgi:GWxTD domain-containing protein|nr:GWxTD domain-containing protein [Thermoanaerobaculia bacterium]